jgi:hypothetical protein
VEALYCRIVLRLLTSGSWVGHRIFEELWGQFHLKHPKCTVLHQVRDHIIVDFKICASSIVAFASRSFWSCFSMINLTPYGGQHVWDRCTCTNDASCAFYDIRIKSEQIHHTYTLIL